MTGEYFMLYVLDAQNARIHNLLEEFHSIVPIFQNFVILKTYSQMDEI